MERDKKFEPIPIDGRARETATPEEQKEYYRELVNMDLVNNIATRVVDIINDEMTKVNIAEKHNAYGPLTVLCGIALVIRSTAERSPRPAPKMIEDIYDSAEVLLTLITHGCGYGVKSVRHYSKNTPN